MGCLEQAREKQLEEARRLAALQKKRELKAAGGCTARDASTIENWSDSISANGMLICRRVEYLR